MQNRIFEDLTNYWRDAQQRFWANSVNLARPTPWSWPWSQAGWGSNTDWGRIVNPSLTPTTSLAERSVKQIKQNLSPDPYRQINRSATQTVHTCLDLQKQVWDYWFRLFLPGSRTIAAVQPDPETVDARPSVYKRKEQPKTIENDARPSTTTKPALRGKPATTSVQLELEAKDDLKKISGIGPGLERKLNTAGIVSYRQIAELSPADIQRLEATIIKFPGRILRDNWIGQAKKQLEK